MARAAPPACSGAAGDGSPGAGLKRNLSQALRKGLEATQAEITLLGRVAHQDGAEDLGKLQKVFRFLAGIAPLNQLHRREGIDPLVGAGRFGHAERSTSSFDIPGNPCLRRRMQQCELAMPVDTTDPEGPAAKLFGMKPPLFQPLVIGPLFTHDYTGTRNYPANPRALARSEQDGAAAQSVQSGSTDLMRASEAMRRHEAADHP
jgi:hypothetical protein